MQAGLSSKAGWESKSTNVLIDFIMGLDICYRIKKEEEQFTHQDILKYSCLSNQDKNFIAQISSTFDSTA